MVVAHQHESTSRRRDFSLCRSLCSFVLIKDDNAGGKGSPRLGGNDGMKQQIGHLCRAITLLLSNSCFLRLSGVPLFHSNNKLVNWITFLIKTNDRRRMMAHTKTFSIWWQFERETNKRILVHNRRNLENFTPRNGKVLRFCSRIILHF